MEKYSSYKDSGVQWLGQIPSHWSINRLASYFTERKTKVSDKDFAPLSVTKMGILPQLENVAKTDDGDNRKLVKVNDFVINSRSDRRGSSGVSPMDGSVSLINIVLSPRPGINPSFCNYLLKSYAFIEEFYRNGHGIVADLWTTRYDEMKMIKICIPPYEEQEAIVAYLDAATAKIDEAIAQQQRMIDLLNERQRIIIEKAVTKGINEDVELIDSGVDYIGSIPSHWETRRLGVLGQFTKGGNISRDDLDDDGPEPAILYGDIYTKYFVKVTDIKNHISSKTASASVLATRGDLLMTGSGETKEDIGKTVVLLAEKAFIGGDVILFKQTKNDNRYLSYVLNSKYSQDYRYRMSKGEIVVHIYPYSLKDLRITLPPVPEQKQIVDYLDTRLQAIDNLKQVVLQQIDILQERKQIIVNDVVTGRVKV